ncbi:type II toxin-antitoxin system HigB family toxin [Candidatus Berkiella cookevillensis]|uniref:Type II toxin-antitoxin system HigB family toxin n=1 Tax=Candidatus Berkiella cookevillensis TaxID=437022 RepID=A0A0Q9YMI5_9GAMM|nr:type II toxin-antitoxin system HigB family toxin [Candidatus Berkiella cookevillensis]MCS5707785.1 type II toxin-antitoxin system HigB family toxin [Candidatus Berkiella cookevillensis]
MNIAGKNLLDEFKKKHADASKWIDNWVADVEGSTWKTPQDIKDKYRSVDFLSNNKVIFDVKGNRYRLEVVVAYNTGSVLVKRIGTHAEYDKWEN